MSRSAFLFVPILQLNRSRSKMTGTHAQWQKLGNHLNKPELGFVRAALPLANPNPELLKRYKLGIYRVGGNKYP